MGLDAVELVMSIEEEFNITIADEEAEKITTPGQMADYLMTRVRTDKNAPCPTQVGFHRLRSVLMDTFGVPREKIRPHALLHNLLPGKHLRQEWKMLASALGATRFPPLEHSWTYFVFVNLGIPLALTALLIVMGIRGLFSVVVFFIALFLIVFYVSFFHVEGTRIPARHQTVGHLTRQAGSTGTMIWTRKTILDRIFLLTSEQLGVPLERIHEHSRFIDDLGMD
jgi:acyl carrier protein